MLENLTWLRHAAFVYDGSQRVYFDLWEVDEREPADVILVSHPHHDHLDPASIAKVRADHTVIVAPAECTAKIGGSVRALKPGQELALPGLTIRAVPAYNLHKSFHPRSNDWVGYIVAMDGKRIYHAGDTDHVPEMADIECDIALLPVGGTYTMTAEEASQAVAVIKPKVVVPMHYGYVVGSREDGEVFRRRAARAVTVLQPKYPFSR